MAGATTATTATTRATPRMTRDVSDEVPRRPASLGRRLRVGVGHPWLGRGGSEARAMWTLQALKGDHDVGLLTAGPVDLDGLNAFYGTSVGQDDIRVDRAPVPRLLRGLRGGDALRGAFYQRHCRRRADAYDVLISTYNACDFGVPAIQCIADFSWDERTRLRFDAVPTGFRGVFHRRTGLRRPYLAAARMIARPSGQGAFDPPNVVLANSAWSARTLKTCRGVDAAVVYPAVHGDFARLPAEERSRGFVYIGRISPEKRIERILSILKEVRRQGQDVHLHIIGEVGGSPYGRAIRAACERETSWVALEGRQSGAVKSRLLTEHQFGINAREGEAFGISVAEMVKAGCITFVPACGGQAEIVDHPGLMFRNEEDAVGKILAVLRSGPRQEALRAHLERRAEVFSEARFVEAMRREVASFAQGRTRSQNA